MYPQNVKGIRMLKNTAVFVRIVIAAACLLALNAIALAHHGWSWTTGGNIELEGVIVSAELGLPHGVVTVDADGEIWKVEVGQPWRNERAGLGETDFAPGKEMRFVGEPSSDIDDRVMKAERIFIGDKEHALYPERD